MCIQQMGQRAILAVGSWNLPSVVCIRLSLKSIKGNFHTQFSSEYKMWGRVAGLSPMGIRVAVGKSFVWWQIVTGRLTSWSREIQYQVTLCGQWLGFRGRAKDAAEVIIPNIAGISLDVKRKTQKRNKSLFLFPISFFITSSLMAIFETIHLLMLLLSILANKQNGHIHQYCVLGTSSWASATCRIYTLAMQCQVWGSDVTRSRTPCTLPGYGEGMLCLMDSGLSCGLETMWTAGS